MIEGDSSLGHAGERQGPTPWGQPGATGSGQILRRFSHWIAVAILIAGLLFYLRNLDARLIESDEGPYFYAAWRISLGEMPYRDFLASPMPLFLYTGGALFKLFGPSVTLVRLFTLLLFIVSAGFLYLAAWRFYQSEVGLIAMTAFLLFGDAYEVGWVYRPDPYMLFFSLAALCVFVWADGRSRRRRWGLAAAGLLFGLSVLTMLSGLLAASACAAFLVYRTLRGDDGGPKARWRGLALALDNLALLVPCLLIVGTVMGALCCITPKVFLSVCGTHLLQGRDLSRWAVFGKGLRLYWI